MLTADKLRAWVCGGTEEGCDTASKGTGAELPASKEHLTATCSLLNTAGALTRRSWQFERDH